MPRYPVFHPVTDRILGFAAQRLDALIIARVWVSDVDDYTDCAFVDGRWEIATSTEWMMQHHPFVSA